MHNQPNDFLTEDQRQFLKLINFVPPPVKITPPQSDTSLFDELANLLAPLRNNDHRRHFKG